MTVELRDGHWTFRDYRQRMTTKEWRELLMEERDNILFHGHFIKLKAKSLGCGIVEVYKEVIPSPPMDTTSIIEGGE